MQQALASRATIGQAIGIARERFSMTEMRPVPIRVAREGNVKLRQVASEVVVQLERAATTGR